MNTKEVAELRRRWRPEKNAVKRIYGCLVNASGGILADLEEPLSMLPLEETEQYFALLKKTLSGRLGKNLVDLVFSTQQVADSEEHLLLMALRGSGLQDAQARHAFYEKAAQTLDLQGNYLLLLAHDTYDAPSKGKDDLELDSDTVFSYLLCAVCPVKEGKPGLGYFAGDNEFHCCVSQTVAPPEYGFLFPAFDDRAANLYNALFYCRRPDSQPQAFLDSVFHTEIPMPAQEQKENFQQSLAEALGEEYSLEVAQEVYSQITGRMEEHKASHDPEPPTITAREMARVLEECDVPQDRVSSFVSLCDQRFGAGAALLTDNLVNAKKVEIKTPQVSVTVEPDYAPMVHTRVIDGQKYLLIPAGEGVEFNGLPVKIPFRKEDGTFEEE